MCTYKGNCLGGLTSGCTYSQKVNSSKDVKVMVKVGLHLGVPIVKK